MPGPVLFGLTGLGGYAGWACDQLLAEQTSPADPGYPPIKLVAVCEPDHVAHAAKIAALRQLGVRVVSTLDELLREKLEALWLPLPIDLHRSFTEKCLAAGKAVLMEKPAAGSIDDVDAMIAARNRTGLPTAVGFQNLFDPVVWAVKKRLLGGAIGSVRAASVLTCWPRSRAYFNRAPWAGKLQHNGVWVLDSPANNAMAHFLNLALFLLGSSQADSANPVVVEAELYRANSIENYDTCCLRYGLGGNVRLMVALTHACQNIVPPVITIEGERGTLQYSDGRFDFTPELETIPAASQRTPLAFRGFAAHVRGFPAVAIATLEHARAHTLAVNGASAAAWVRDIPQGIVRVTTGADGAPLITIPGIEAALFACARDGKMLHESGMLPWANEPSPLHPINVSHFAGTFYRPISVQ